MTLALTNPTVVPTHSAVIGTSFWITSVTRTAGGGGGGGVLGVQPIARSMHAPPMSAARRAGAARDPSLGAREPSDSFGVMSVSMRKRRAERRASDGWRTILENASCRHRE
jgi:hypothetical protein